MYLDFNAKLSDEILEHTNNSFFLYFYESEERNQGNISNYKNNNILFNYESENMRSNQIEEEQTVSDENLKLYKSKLTKKLENINFEELKMINTKLEILIWKIYPCNKENENKYFLQSLILDFHDSNSFSGKCY